MAQQYQTAALGEVREEYGQYFEALEKHPRLLVGTQVPRLDGKEGHEVLRDPADAREWQDAVKSLLVEEVRSRAGAAMDENAGQLNTLHASIELFQKNADLVPGTKSFDRDLADRFAKMAKPYELRDDGKLIGYTIPVQPIIESLRADLTAQRAATPPPVAAPAAAAPAKPAAEPPQAGITSKAGSSTEGAEDFSTLFGTIGLPNFTI